MAQGRGFEPGRCRLFFELKSSIVSGNGRVRTAHARNLDFREGEFDFLGGSARAHTYLVLRMRKRPYTHEPDKLSLFRVGNEMKL